MSKSYVLVVVLTLALLVALLAFSGAPLLAFVDLPSLGIVVAPAILMGFAGHSPREIAGAFRVAFARQGATRKELEEAEAYFDGLARYLVCGGLLGIVVGAVSMLLAASGLGVAAQEFERQVTSAVGKGVALCLLSLFYTLVLIVLVALPFRTAIRKRLAAA
jgi:hypothetical protein